MKKIVLTFFSIVLFLSGISHIEAKTLMEPTSDNGNVKINLSFEEGFVGGIDATFKINGQVSLTGVNWSSVIASNYTKRYSYDEQNGTVRLIVTTGNQKNNLVDKKGNLTLGTLTFKSKTSDKTTYTIELASLTIVDATYQSIVKNDLELKGNNQFVVSGSSSNTGGNTGNDNPPTKPSDNNSNNSNSSNNSGSSSNGGTITKPLVPSNGNNQNNNQVGDEKNPSDEEILDEEETPKEEEDSNQSNIDKDNSNKNNSSSNGNKTNNENQKQEEQKKKSFPFRTVGIAFIVVSLLALIGRKLKH